MADIKPFRAWRPQPQFAHKTAALPYDVYNREEAREAALKEPLSFLNIDRPETQFSPDQNMYSDEVYAKADEVLHKEMSEGIYIQDGTPCYYLYELTMNGHVQTGLVACVSLDNYLEDVVKKHENTRPEKELDRIRHIDKCSAQTGPIFLTYHANALMDSIVVREKENRPVYDFQSDDHIHHRCWIIKDTDTINAITHCFKEIDDLYIADGHHRSASAVKAGLKRREKYPDYMGNEEFNSFLSVIFPDNQLNILPYYRVVKDLNQLTAAGFFDKIECCFEVEPNGDEPVVPGRPYEFGCYLYKKWYKLKLKESCLPQSLLKKLDVSILQNLILEPILGIKNPKTDKRIKFVGGIRGTEELERLCNDDMTVAFTLYPTSIKQLFDVADAGLLMPPKSTWFEPKLRSGLFIHEIER